MKDIINRLKKLITLAENSGATEGEADNAMRMTHRLLIKHNLSMESVLSQKEESDIVEEFVATDSKSSQWKKLIYANTGYLYFCTHIFSENRLRKTVRHFFVGKQDNIETAKVMTPYFIKSVQKLSESYIFIKPQHKKDFLLGCTLRLVGRMQELRDSLIMENGTGRSIAVLYEKNDKEISEFLENKGIKNVESKLPARKTPTSAFITGYISGSEINLDKQLTSKKGITA